MSGRPLLLDLFCGAGGCAVGYHRAGFDVVGVDVKPQKRYPFTFIQADALQYAERHSHRYAFIHASPPCQAYSSTRHLPNTRTELHVDLLATTRELLSQVGRPWVIENVMGAPMRRPAIMLCGLMFALRVFRHRWFECPSVLLLAPDHVAHGDRVIGVGGMVCVVGSGGCRSSGWTSRHRGVPPDHRNKAAWSRGMGIDWMTRYELSQAIPPAYTEFIGRQLLNAIEATP